jgi:hypothetical protein
MVNAGAVNGAAPCVPHAHFCEIFRAFARFLRLQNPFKYIRRFEINHKTVHFCLPAARAMSGGSVYYQCASHPLTLQKGAFPIMAS